MTRVGVDENELDSRMAELENKYTPLIEIRTTSTARCQAHVVHYRLKIASVGWCVLPLPQNLYKFNLFP